MPDPNSQQPFCAWCGHVAPRLHWVTFAPTLRRQLCDECRQKLIKLLDQHQPVPVPQVPQPAVQSQPPRSRGRPHGPRRVQPV